VTTTLTDWVCTRYIGFTPESALRIALHEAVRAADGTSPVTAHIVNAAGYLGAAVRGLGITLDWPTPIMASPPEPSHQQYLAMSVIYHIGFAGSMHAAQSLLPIDDDTAEERAREIETSLRSAIDCLHRLTYIEANGATLEALCKGEVQ
jgi:hypothetical protein